MIEFLCCCLISVMAAVSVGCCYPKNADDLFYVDSQEEDDLFHEYAEEYEILEVCSLDGTTHFLVILGCSEDSYYGDDEDEWIYN